MLDAPPAQALPRLRTWVRLDARTGRYLLGVAAFAVAYYVVAQGGYALQFTGSITAIWPPVGLAVGVLYLGGLRWWPGAVIGDILSSDSSIPVGTTVALHVANLAEMIVATILLWRLIGRRAQLDRLDQVGGMLLAIAPAVAISATIGTASLWADGIIHSGELASIWRTLWLGDTSGALVVLPLILVWGPFLQRARASRRLPSRDRALEAAVVAAAVIGLSILSLSTDRPVSYVVFPALIWAALRFGQPGATLALAGGVGLAVWRTAHNVGPFVQHSISDSALSTQLYIAVAAVTTLCLGAIVSERKRGEADLRALADEQAALRRVATAVASEGEPSRIFARVTEEVGRLLGAQSANLIRYEDLGSATVVGGWTAEGASNIEVGTTIPLDGATIAVEVRSTGRPARVDSYEDVGGELAQRLRRLGFHCAVAAPITLEGRIWGAVIVSSLETEPFPPGAELRLAEFAELIAQALANADARTELTASRARLVHAADAERRRLERNLHDGAQQRLVATSLMVGMAGRQLANDPDATHRLLSDAGQELTLALAELRELAQGLHPAILTNRGLVAALEALAARAPVPVTLSVGLERRLPEPIEVAAYYLVSEALTNVAKYADATEVRVTVQRGEADAVVTVVDNGIGGADPASGSGLRGLTDRVEALGGRVEVRSPAGVGTTIEARLPCSSL
jgi:signal transduction histidine kinase